MKVLVVWEQVPENVSFYVVEGLHADIAIAAAGQYINGGCYTDDVEKLNEILVDYEPIEADKAFDITGFDKVVCCGWIL